MGWCTQPLLSLLLRFVSLSNCVGNDKDEVRCGYKRSEDLEIQTCIRIIQRNPAKTTRGDEAGDANKSQ